MFPKTLIFVVVSALLLTGCAPVVVTVTVPPSPLETVVVTATPSPTPPPTPTPLPKPHVLTVCLLGEPDTLYLYGGSHLPATQQVLSALYDGPIDHLEYGYRPVLLQKLPSFADGDALVRVVQVHAGDRVVDAAGRATRWGPGVRVIPARCLSPACAVEFDGGPVWMERMQVRFTLRDDVTWDDGEPLTAADSVFAFRVASDPATVGARYLVSRTLRYTARDDYHLEWVGVPGFLPSDYFLNFFAPLPRHQLAGRSPADLAQDEDLRRRPPTWGPFVVEDWIPADRLILAPNPHYSPAPHLDKIVFRFATDGADMVARLLAGECDIATHDADLTPFLPLLMKAEQQGLLHLISAPGTGWEHLEFDIAPTDDRPPFFGDARVRQAVAHCVDRETVVAEATYGRGLPLDSYLPPTHPFHAAGLPAWEYDPAAGRALLEEAGWVDEDSDGVREAHRVSGVRTGTPFEVTLLLRADDEAALRSARAIKAQLADCGLRVNLDARPFWELFAPAPDGPLFGRHFDLAETTWWLDVRPMCEHYLSPEVAAESVTGYADPDFDAACLGVGQTFPGTAEHAEYRRRAQELFAADLPALPLFMRLRFAVVRPRVQGFTLDSTSPGDLWNAESLDVTVAGE